LIKAKSTDQELDLMLDLGQDSEVVALEEYVPGIFERSQQLSASSRSYTTLSGGSRSEGVLIVRGV
jgi:hypothetical protein